MLNSKLSLAEYEIICQEYINGLDTVKLAKKYGVKPPSIRKILIKFGIPRRNASEKQRGERNHRYGKRSTAWKGGRRIKHDGYVSIWIGCKYEYEHRMIMQKYLGRDLTPDELVHHIDGDKTNNKIENLEIVDRSNHLRIHDAYRERNDFGQYV